MSRRGTPHEFEVDRIDVSSEPGYDAVVNSTGLFPQVSWAITDAAVRAKQLEMTEIDRDLHARWDATMQDLLAKGLGDAEFTAQRMFRLRLFHKERKRLQHNLHYKYDVRRRRRGLVERDVRATLARAETLSERLEAVRDQFEVASGTAAVAPVPPSPMMQPRVQSAASLERELVRQAAERVARVTDGSPPAVVEAPWWSATIIGLIAADTMIADPTLADDDTIIDAYARLGVPHEVSEIEVAKMRALVAARGRGRE